VGPRGSFESVDVNQDGVINREEWEEAVARERGQPPLDGRGGAQQWSTGHHHGSHYDQVSLHNGSAEDLSRQVSTCVDTVKSLTTLVDQSLKREDSQRATFEMSVSHRIEEVGSSTK